jgi:hypothetical protein
MKANWTASRAVLGKEQPAVKEALHEVEHALPFGLRGWTRTAVRDSSTGI